MSGDQGFKAIEKRIEELVQQTGTISPAHMLALLKRAEANPSFDIEKELERLLNSPGANR